MEEVDLAAVGGRVRAARERAGLSQRDVESRTEITQSMLQRIESGKRTTASLSDFDRIAQALDVALDELLYGSAVEARVIAVARASGYADDVIRSAMRPGVELLKLDDRLDSVVSGLRQVPRHPSVEVPGGLTPQARGRAAAEAARAALGLGEAAVADVADAIERLTGVDFGTALLPAGFPGFRVTDPQRATSIILVNSDDVAERQRFTAAHELAHVLFGDGASLDHLNGERTAQEIACDEFARHLLVPEAGVRSWLAGTAVTGETVTEERTMALLARHFGVSPDVARIQLDRMGLLNGRLRDSILPTGRRWAYRYGWGDQFDSDQAAAAQPRAPRRLLDRAMEAYRVGMLGIGVLANLHGRTPASLQQALTEAGVEPRPAIRRADIAMLVERARARKSIEGGDFQ